VQNNNFLLNLVVKTSKKPNHEEGIKEETKKLDLAKKENICILEIIIGEKDNDDDSNNDNINDNIFQENKKETC